MRFERIDENKFSCTITHAELQQLNLKLSDLSYGTGAARRFFQDILKQAQEEIDFEPEELPLMIEAIPTKEDGLIIQFSYVEEPDELDSRFAQFAPYMHNEGDAEAAEAPVDPFADSTGADDILNRLKENARSKQSAETALPSSEQGEGALLDAKPEDPKVKTNFSVFVNGKEVKNPPSSKEFLSSLFGSIFQGNTPESGGPSLGGFFQKLKEFSGEDPDAPETNTVNPAAAVKESGSDLCIMFRFADFNDLVSVCHRIAPFSGLSRLYKQASSGLYILTINSLGVAPDDFNRTCNLLSEYGNMEREHTELTALSMEEHGECLIREHAIEHLASFMA